MCSKMIIGLSGMCSVLGSKINSELCDVLTMLKQKGFDQCCRTYGGNNYIYWLSLALYSLQLSLNNNKRKICDIMDCLLLT